MLHHMDAVRDFYSKYLFVEYGILPGMSTLFDLQLDIVYAHGKRDCREIAIIAPDM